MGPANSSRFGRYAWRVLVPVIALVAVGAVILFRNYPRRFVIPGESMLPTIRAGGAVMVDMEAYGPDSGPKREHLIVFTSPLEADRICEPGSAKQFLKRVVALPGEVLEIDRGQVFINAERINEPYLHPQRDTSDYGPLKVPRGHYFVMGDNRANSQDSRYSLGPIPIGHVCGKVTEILD